MKRKYIYIGVRLLVVVAAIYAYFELRRQIPQQQRRDDTIQTVLIRDDFRAQDAVWFSFYHHQSPEKTYVDLDGQGRLLMKKQSGRTMEVRRAAVEREMLKQIFGVVRDESVLRVVDSDPGEPIFSDETWLSGGYFINGRRRSLGPAPFGRFPEGLRNVLSRLQKEGQAANMADVALFVVAEPVSGRRREAIENDQRALYRFVTVQTEAVPKELLQAMNMPGRQVPVEENESIQSINALRSRSNVNATGNDFFISFDGRSFQIQMLSGS